MFDRTGQIVQATAGRDQGGLFCVVGIGSRQGTLLLADGKRRKAAHPKVKNTAHIRTPEGASEFDHPAIQKLKQGVPVSDRELRRALAAFKEGITLGER